MSQDDLGRRNVVNLIEDDEVIGARTPDESAEEAEQEHEAEDGPWVEQRMFASLGFSGGCSRGGLCSLRRGGSGLLAPAGSRLSARHGAHYLRERAEEVKAPRDTRG